MARETVLKNVDLTEYIDPEFFLSPSSDGGLGDFVIFADPTSRGEFSSCYYGLWQEVLRCSDLKLGGYMVYNRRVPENPSLVGMDDETACCDFPAMMEAYDKYLCSDGRVMFVPDPISDVRYRALSRQYRLEYEAENYGKDYDDGS